MEVERRQGRGSSRRLFVVLDDDERGKLCMYVLAAIVRGAVLVLD